MDIMGRNYIIITSGCERFQSFHAKFLGFQECLYVGLFTTFRFVNLFELSLRCCCPFSVQFSFTLYCTL